MKRSISILALAILFCMSTNVHAQTRTSQLVVTNSTGTTKFSQTADGMLIDNHIVLQRPGNPLSTLTLTVPAGNGTRNFAFPEDGGTLLTTALTAPNGEALIASINAATVGTINAARLNVVGGGGVNLADANTWLDVQTFPTIGATGISQGNALINSINVGTVELTNYSTTAEMTTAISAARVGGMFAGGTVSNNMSQSSTNYYFPNGRTDGGNTSQGLSTTHMIATRTGVIKNFRFALSAAPGASRTRTFSVMNLSTGGNLAIAITGTSTTEHSGANTLAVNAGDRIQIRQVPSNSPADGHAIWGFEIE